MEELVKSLRLGVVQIFGILVPGLALLASLAYPAYRAKNQGASACTIDWTAHRIEVVAIVLTLAYVLGFVIRLIPTEWLDRFSIRWRNRQQKHEGKKLVGQYPYRNFKKILGYAGLEGLASYVKWDETGPEPTRAQINSLKLLVASESEVLSSSLTSTEANIRMMFGIFVAGFVAFPVSLCSAIVQMIRQHTFWVVGHFMLLAAILCSLVLIFHTFTNTRCTELVRLMLALKVCAAKEKSIVTSVMRGFEYSEEAIAAAEDLTKEDSAKLA